MTNVLAVVQHQIRLLVEADRILSAIDELPTQNLGVKSVDTQIAALEAEIERYKDLKSKVYKDMTDGIVSRDEFKDINTRFTDKINSAKTAQEELIVKREKLLSRENNSRPWMETFREYRNVSELDRKLIASLIASIVVYDTDTVEIHFHYEDEIQEMLEMASSLCEEFAEREVAVV